MTEHLPSDSTTAQSVSERAQSVETSDTPAPADHDTGNGMSSQSQWTGDEAISRGVAPAGQPATNAGSALGGDPTRSEPDTDQGVPESFTEGDGRSDTGTTFSADPSGDKRL